MIGIRRGAVLAAALLAAACAGKPRQAFDPGAGDRLETLTSYTLALSKRDFKTAAGLLAPVDRAHLLDADGQMKPEFRDRLRAMRFTTLAANPLVTIEHGRIRGIYDLLPVLDQGEPAPVVSDVPDNVPVPALEDEPGREELRVAATAFFRSVRAQDFRRAVGMLAPGERRAFMREDGKMKEGSRRRLAAVDTAAWDAMTLEEGKLTGVVLIIPARAPERLPRDVH